MGTNRELLPIPMLSSGRVDVYSGVARKSGVIFGAAVVPDGGSRTAALVIHPASNFLGHYALAPLAERGIAAIGLATRYVGNDSALLMENCVLDVAAAVTYLRDQGYDKVVLVGNSGGGGLAAMYQSQAEHPTITSTPAGDPPDLTALDLPPVDGIVLMMAHPGRASTLTEWLDPAIIDESDPFVRDPELDLFAPGRSVPLDAEFLARYRAAQIARNRRITAWVKEQLIRAEAAGHADLPFVVHGTCADPRFVDLTIEPSDRVLGTLWGDARTANLMPASLGHHCSLRSWLSQWSIDDTQSDGPAHLAHVSVPVLVIYGTADNAAFPEHAMMLYEAVGHSNKSLVALAGADHYFTGRPDLLEDACSEIATWLTQQGLLTA